MTAPHKFEPFHEAIREPFDYYKFGNDFFAPLIIENESKLFGVDNAKKIKEIMAKGENVVILSNHQTEADPQVLSLLLEKVGLGDLAEKMVFIAGHKVTNDPVAIPFSMGRNLLCIHSKKHIKNPPEEAPMKMAQNLESMKAMSGLMSAAPSEPGSVFWVAPSGGRDRPGSDGEFEVPHYTTLYHTIPHYTTTIHTLYHNYTHTIPQLYHNYTHTIRCRPSMPRRWTCSRS